MSGFTGLNIEIIGCSIPEKFIKGDRVFTSQI